MTKILITGASGYIGGRLLHHLDDERYQITCMARNPLLLANRFSHKIKIVKGDTLDIKSLEKALHNVDVAFYLVHSMGSKGNFEEEERASARNFITACEKNNVKKIVYLGGIIPNDNNLSPHLQSRLDVGDILRTSKIPVMTLRASIIIGSGSLSFELIRSLAEHLPFMITPKWVLINAQPISVHDVLRYLEASINIKLAEHKIFEIGGKDIVSYLDLIKMYCEYRNLKRIMIPVPFLSPYLSSLWLGLITPLYAKIGRKLIESVRHATVVSNQTKTDSFFNINTMGIKDAIHSAMENEEKEFALTHWADSYSSSHRIDHSWEKKRFGNRLVYLREIDINASLDSVFLIIKSIGGKNGWYYATFLWKIRGYLDLLVKGVGHKRGRRDQTNLRVGDILDWWRVEQIEKNKRIRLLAEMKLPGRGWLEFELKEENNTVNLYVSSIFDPIGLFGRLYWYALYPLHFIVFSGMMNQIKKRAERKSKI